MGVVIEVGVGVVGFCWRAGFKVGVAQFSNVEVRVKVFKMLPIPAIIEVDVGVDVDIFLKPEFGVN